MVRSTTDQATVRTSYDDPQRAALEVRAEEGMPAARAGARLVRDAVLDAAARGTRTVWATLDVSTPVCGAALEELRELADHGFGDLRVRRVGGSVLVDFQLSASLDGTVVSSADHRSPASAADPGRPRPAEGPPPRRQRPRRAAAPGLDNARTAKALLRAELASRRGVCGVGLARQKNGYRLRVNVVDASVDVPRLVDGVPVEVRITGALAPAGE
jgi:hypothetical protein